MLCRRFSRGARDAVSKRTSSTTTTTSAPKRLPHVLTPQSRQLLPSLASVSVVSSATSVTITPSSNEGQWQFETIAGAAMALMLAMTGAHHSLAENSSDDKYEITSTTYTQTPSRKDTGGSSAGTGAGSTKQASLYFPYVILGSGTTALAALEAIEHQDPGAKVLMIASKQTVPRIDIRDGAGEEELDHALLNVYNEWRRHLQNRLDWNIVGGSGSCGGSEYEDRGGNNHGSNSDSNEGEAGSSANVPGGVVPEHPALLTCQHSALRVDVERRRIHMADGTTYKYGACLLATTGKPNPFYVLDSTKMSYSLRGRINTVRKLSDFQELERIVHSEGAKHITVVGGGFLGSELVLTLAQMGRNADAQAQQEVKNNSEKDSGIRSEGTQKRVLELRHVFVEDGPLRKHLPDYLSAVVEEHMNRHGIVTLSQRVVTSLEPTEKKKCWKKGEGYPLDPSCIEGESDIDAGADDQNQRPQVTVNLMGLDRHSETTNYVVLATTHVQPDIYAVKHSALELDENNGGLVTNALFEVQSGFFAAGTAASFFDTKLGRRRVHTYDHAVNSGLCAGQNMVAAVHGTSANHPVVRYRHQPVFRSHLPGTGLLLEGIGNVDADLTTVGVWLTSRDAKTGEVVPDQKYSRGIIYYLKGNVVVGAVAVNASECVGLLREVLNEQRVVGEYKSLRRRVQLAPEHWLKVIVTNPKESSW